MVYDDRHRTFLQAIMQGGIVLDQEASTLCMKIFGKYTHVTLSNERIKVSTVAKQINDKLAPLAMAMTSGMCEMTGDLYWSVVSTTHEEAVSMPSEYNVNQRAFLREIFSEIISADDGCISSTDALNLTTTLDIKLSVGDADQFIKLLTRKKWLYIKEGFIYMGVRSIVELMPYFRATYQENFHNCFLCKEVIFHGQKCENCDKMFHNYCLAKFINMHKQKKCPQCKNAFNIDDIPDEVMASQIVPMETEDEPMNIDDDTVMMASQPVSTSKRSKKRSRV